jgi:predicted RNA binding protein YcfA (HicA-like mRNA interferase family)
VFPSLKGRELLAVLMRKPLLYRVDRQTGSHRTLKSGAGYPDVHFSFHEGVTVPRGAVKKVLTKDVGLSEQEALALL